MPIFLSINTNVNLAPFAEKRLKFIREQFKDIADPNSPLPDQVPAFVASNMLTKENVIFADNQTHYTIDQISKPLELGRFFRPLATIIDRYELSENFSATILLRWIENSKDYQMFEKSMGFVDHDFINKIQDICGGFHGFGVRLIRKAENGSFDDIKIEPFLVDPSKIFFEATHNLLTNINTLESEILHIITHDEQCVSKIIAEM